MTNERYSEDDFVVRIPRAGYEAAAVGSVVSTDLNAGGTDSIIGDAAENFGGGILGYAVYQAALTFLILEPEVKAKRITRGEQFKQVRMTTWEACKNSVVVVTAISVLLAIFPMLTPVAALSAIVGGAIAGTRLVNAILSAYSPEQKAALKEAATNAGVTITGLTDDQAPAASPA